MDGATLVTAARSVNLGRQEVPMVLSSQVQQITFSLPGDQSVSITRIRPLTVKERKDLLDLWNSDSGAAGLSKIAAASKGALKFEYTGGADATDEVRVRPLAGGASRQVPRWVFDTFLKKGAPAKGSDTWVQVTE